jgi:uncharacterized protein DUF4253
MIKNFRHPLHLLVIAGAALLMMGGASQPDNSRTTQSQATGTASSAVTATARSSVTGTAKSLTTGTASSAVTATARSNGTGTAKSSMTGSAGNAAVTQTPLSPYAEELARILKFDRQVMVLVKEETQEHIQRLIGYDEKDFQIIAPGFAVPVPEDRTDRVLAVLRQKLAPLHYLAFVVEMNAGLKMDKIGVIKGMDQYEILRIMHTDGSDYDISNEDVIDRLKEWEKISSFDIVGADSDWVEIEFKTLPRDLKAFAEDVYDFSPDAVEQGPGSVEGLVKEIRRTNRLFLWWD